MEKYQLEDLADIRGFFALTQGEEDIESLLLNNCNKLKSKRRGFNQTRIHCLSEIVNRETIETWASICKEKIEDSNNTLYSNSLIFVCEKMLRDHVTIQMAWEFRRNFNLRVQTQGIDSAIESLLSYVKSGRVEPITRLYLTACNENEKGMI